jgi:hypothetical protein
MGTAKRQKRFPSMNHDPAPPQEKSRLMLIIGGIVLFIVFIILFGMSLSHFSEMKGGSG